MKLTTRMLTLVLPSLFSLACEAVRRQAARFSPSSPGSVQPYSHSVARAPGMVGQLHAPTREMRSLPLAEGEAAEAVTSGPGAEHGSQTRDWVADYFKGDDTEASEFPMTFGLDELDADGMRSISHLGLEDQGDAAHGRIEWTDGSNPLFSWRVRPPPERSLAGSVKVTEEHGEGQRTEESRITSGPGAERRSAHDADFFHGDDTEASEFPMNFGFDELDRDGTRAISHMRLKDQGRAAHGKIEWTDGSSPLFSWRVGSPPETGVTGSAKVTEEHGEGQRTEESRITSGPRAERRSRTHDADFFRGDDTEASEFPMNFGFDELDRDGTRAVSHMRLKDQGHAAHGRIDWTEDRSPLFSWRVHGV